MAHLVSTSRCSLRLFRRTTKGTRGRLLRPACGFLKLQETIPGRSSRFSRKPVHLCFTSAQPFGMDRQLCALALTC